MIYTVSFVTPNYVAKDSGNNVVASNAAFGTMFNALNALLTASDIVYFIDETNTITVQCIANKDGVTYLGQSRDGTILKANTGMTDQPIGLDADDVVFDSLTLDANGNTYGSGSFFEAKGLNFLIQNCRIKGATNYSFVIDGIDGFSILNCIGQSSVYGLTVASSGHSAAPAKNGVVAYNTIIDNDNAGIKLKFCEDILVHHNEVDVAYITWPGNSGCGGIRFYQADGQTIDCTVYNNHVYDSKHLGETWGIVVDGDTHLDDPDSEIDSSGQIIRDNEVQDIYHGVYIGNPNSGVQVTGNYIHNCVEGVKIVTGVTSTVVTGNRIIECTNPVVDDGTGTTRSGNLYDTSWTTGLRKLTTSSNITASAVIQGYTLAVNEVCYTEQGSVLTISAENVSGYILNSFIINGASYSPDGSNEYSLTVGAMDYTIQVYYTSSTHSEVAFNDPTEDAYVYFHTPTYGRSDIASSYLEFGNDGGYIVRSYVEWDVSSIPDNATITSVKLKYDGGTHLIDGHIHAITIRPSSADAETLYGDYDTEAIYSNVDGFPIYGNNQEIDLGASAVVDLQEALSGNNWFAVGFQSDSEATAAFAYIYSENSVTATPKPTLYVTYTNPVISCKMRIKFAKTNVHMRAI